MTEIASQSVSSYGLLFEGCPDPCMIVEGDVVITTNAAFHAQFGATRTSLRSCIDDRDVEKILYAPSAPAKFNARPAIGVHTGKPTQWTTWPIEGGRACVRMDGPASIAPEIPAALAPLFTEPLTLAGMIAGKMLETLDATVWSIGKDGTILVSEGAALAHYNIAPGQLVGLNAFQIYPEGSVPANDLEATMKGERVRADQSEPNTHWLRACDPVRDASGEVTAMVGFAWCVTEITREIRQARVLLSAVSKLPVTVWAMEADGTCTLSVGTGPQLLAMEPGEIVGKNLLEVYASSPETMVDLERALQGETVAHEVRVGESTWFSTLVPVRNAFGDKVTQVYGVAENVTERSLAQQRMEEQLALIKAQQLAISELTSPIIEVWQGVLVVPLIGALDGERANRLLEVLLREVVGRQSESVILDLTGVNVVDPSTAQNIFDIMRSVRLLGAEGLVSGIRPNVAKTMVELDVAGTSWKTFPTLAQALRRLISKRVRTG